jgi:hypothetical protein
MAREDELVIRTSVKTPHAEDMTDEYETRMEFAIAKAVPGLQSTNTSATSFFDTSSDVDHIVTDTIIEDIGVAPDTLEKVGETAVQTEHDRLVTLAESSRQDKSGVDLEFVSVLPPSMGHPGGMN